MRSGQVGRWREWKDGRGPAGAFLLVVLAWLVLPPLGTLIVTSLHGTTQTGALGRFTWHYFASVWGHGQMGPLLGNTLGFSVGSSALALALGMVEAWLVERTDAPGRGLLTATAVMSLAVPYVLYTMAWILVLGNNGPFNQWIGPWFGSHNGRWFHLDSLPGMVLVEGFLWSPLVFLLLSSVLRNFDPRLEEASWMAGATPGQTVRGVALPILLPAILSVALLVFVRSFQAFEVPALVGLPGNVSVLASQVYVIMTEFAPPDYGQASAMSVYLLIAAAICFAIYFRVLGTAHRYHMVTGKGFRHQRLRLGPWRWLAGLFVGLDFAIKLVVPLGWLIWTAVLRSYQLPSPRALGDLTWENFRSALQYPNFTSAAFHTLVLAILASTGIMLLTWVAAWLGERSRLPARRLVDYVASAPLAFPAIVLGVGVLEFYLNMPVPIYGSLLILLIGYLTLFMPYGMRYLQPAVMHLSPELEEAAQIAGASPWVSFRNVVAPLTRSAFWAGWLFILLLVARELTLSVFLVSPGNEVVAVELFDLWNNGQLGQVAAFGVIWTAVMTVIALGFWKLVHRRDIELNV